MGGGQKGVCRVGTVGERELSDEDLRAEDDNQGIGYFDRNGDTDEIHDHSKPGARSKVGEGCSVAGLLGGGCRRRAPRSYHQEIETVFISQEI
jgi:hypothetical protein